MQNCNGAADTQTDRQTSSQLILKPRTLPHAGSRQTVCYWIIGSFLSSLLLPVWHRKWVVLSQCTGKSMPNQAYPGFLTECHFQQGCGLSLCLSHKHTHTHTSWEISMYTIRRVQAVLECEFWGRTLSNLWPQHWLLYQSSLIFCYYDDHRTTGSNTHLVANTQK